MLGGIQRPEYGGQVMGRCAAALAICSAAMVTIGSAAPVSSATQNATTGPSKRIMVLHSFGRDFKPWDEYARTIRAELERQSRWPLDITDHSLLTARSSHEDEAPFVEYLRALHAKSPLDLIVSIGAPAAAFVQRHRADLFASTPMVFTAVEERRVQSSLLTPSDAVVAVRIDYLGAFKNILRVLPDTRKVVVIVGTSPIEQFWRAEIGRQVQPLADRVTFAWTNALSFEEILKQAAALPPHTAIFWELMLVDAAGVVHEGNTALARLHAVSKAPIFSYDESFFGGEIVGGPMHSVVEGSRLTAAVALRILGGEKAGDIKIAPLEFAAPKFDWRELKRWSISESRLPAGSIVQFREPTAWEQYSLQILAIAAALLLQTLLIVWFVHEHRRRRIAEAEALQRVNELARMNRFATAGQLAASIAHEIRQPLSAVVAAATAGLNWLKRPAPDLAEARLAMEKAVEESHHADDVIKGVRAMFRKETQERRQVDLNEVIEQIFAIAAGPIKSNDILLEAHLAKDAPPVVTGDPIQLQQVILNLVMNAVEAMRESPNGARVLRIETEAASDGTALIRVRDSGPSVDPKVADQMFEPFFTTKSGGMGMGLSICKTIIEAHGGLLTATPNNPRGMEFQIVLPAERH